MSPALLAALRKTGYDGYLVLETSAGDDPAAKAKVAAVLAEFGWGVVDVGGIASSRYLEAMCLVWVLFAFSSGAPSWNHAFKMLRK